MTRSGGSVSANAVKPRRSAKSTVAWRRTPPSRRSSPAFESTSLTTGSGTKRANASRTRWRSSVPSIRATPSVPKTAVITAPSGWTRGRMSPDRKASTTIATYAAATTTITGSISLTPQRSPSAGARHASSAMMSASSSPPERESGSPRRTVEIALAWTSPPAMTSSLLVGTGWTSCSFGAEAPTTTTRPRKASAGNRPRSTRENEYVGTVPGGPR